MSNKFPCSIKCTYNEKSYVVSFGTKVMRSMVQVKSDDKVGTQDGRDAGDSLPN